MKTLILLCTLLMSTTALANICEQNNNTVTFTGLDSGDGRIYASIQNDGKCNCNYVRFTPQNTNTEMALSILMTAKVAGSKVRIDLKVPGDCNSAYRVYLQ